jgi:hypothetical protein
MKKEKFIEITSKINETHEDEFRAKYNSPELISTNLLEKYFKTQNPALNIADYSSNMKKEIIKIMLGWIENNEPIENTANKILDCYRAFIFITMESKEALLRETRKLISILNNYGNVLVPAIEGRKETFAHDKLIHVVNRLKNEFNLTEEQIDEEMLDLS